MKIKITYWILTVLFAVFMIFSAIPDIMKTPDAITFMTHLGYPVYFIPFIGVAKILGVIAILIPGFPRIKEWAYAGLMYDLMGATYSVFAVGDQGLGWVFMLIIMAWGFMSYIFYHKKLNAASTNTNK